MANKKVLFKGIDISYYQGNVNFTKVKDSGVQFVILRAGLGKKASQVDKKFNTYYKNATAVGIPVGCYWYSYATTVEEAKLEAKACLEVIKGKKFEYPIWYDIEEASTFATGKRNVSNIAKAFCSVLEEAGYFTGIYCSTFYAKTYFTEEVQQRYAFWIAQYASKCTYANQYGIWQYSSTGKVNGIVGNVDMDYSYTDYPTSIKSKGLNGFPKPVPVEPKKKRKKGDVNGDEKVDPTDASIILNEYANTEVMGNPSKLSSEQKEAADYNGDGKITPDDATGVLKEYANEIMNDE